MIKQEVKKKEFSHENNSHLLLVGGVALLFRSFYATARHLSAAVRAIQPTHVLNRERHLLRIFRLIYVQKRRGGMEAKLPPNRR
jgi:hypothetical protein